MAGLPGNFLEQRERLIQRGAVSRADVDGSARRTFCFGGQQIRFDDVSDVDEIARLLAVAVHSGLRSFHHGRVEQ